MRRARKMMTKMNSLYRRNRRRDTEQNGNRELIGKRGFVTSWHRKLGLQEDLPSDDGRCNRTIHLFAALHGHTPIGRNHGVRHRHLEAGNIRRAYLHHIRSTEVRSIGELANQRQHDNLYHSCTSRASWHRRNHPGNKQRCTLYATRGLWQSFVDDGAVQQSKLSNNAHEAPSRSGIKLNTVNEDTLSALTSLGNNAKLKETEQSGARCEAFQSRSRSLQRQRPTRERRSPSQERPIRQKKRPTRPKKPLRWQRLELPQR